MNHIKETAAAVEQYINKGLSVCVVNPCGSGKSLVMGEVIRKHPEKTFLILSKQRNAGPYFRSLNPVFMGKNITIATYAKMHSDVKSGDISGYRADYYLVDEAHYLGAVHWGQSFRKLTGIYDPVCIGFTATPQRYDDQGTEKTIVTDYFDGRSAGNFTSCSLQEQGVFTEPEYVLGVRDLEAVAARKYLEIEDSGLSGREKTDIWKKLERSVATWKENSSPERILGRHLPAYMYKDSCNRILVYTKDIASVEKDREWLGAVLRGIFPGKEVKEYSYTFKDPEENLRDFMREEKGSYIKVLYSVNKVAETVHIDDLKVVIMLRPSESGRVITQQLGRVNSIRDKRRPLIVDFVSNLERLRALSSTIRGADGKFWGHTGLYAGRYDGSILHLYTKECRNVFEETDRAVPKRMYYTCMGFTGTLNDICYVFGCDVRAVETALMLTHDIEEAVRSVPRKICRSYRPGPPVACLLKEGLTYAEENIYIAEDYIKRHGITDSDIQQEVYEAYLTAVSKLPYRPENGLGAREIQAALRTRYLKVCRTRQQKRDLVTVTGSPASVKAGDFEEAMFDNCMKDALFYAMSTLNEKERKVITARYGLDGRPPKTVIETGKALNLSIYSVNKAESMAMRKLRHPSRSGPLKGYLT